MLRARLRERRAIYQRKESHSTRAGYLPTSLAMSNVEQRSMVTSRTDEALVSSQALGGYHEMTEFGDESRLLRALPPDAHRINVQTHVEVQNEPRNASVPLNGKFDV
jgi:hypothetical protein